MAKWFRKMTNLNLNAQESISNIAFKSRMKRIHCMLPKYVSNLIIMMAINVLELVRCLNEWLNLKNYQFFHPLFRYASFGAISDCDFCGVFICAGITKHTRTVFPLLFVLSHNGIYSPGHSQTIYPWTFIWSLYYTRTYHLLLVYIGVLMDQRNQLRFMELFRVSVEQIEIIHHRFFSLNQVSPYYRATVRYRFTSDKIQFCLYMFFAWGLSTLMTLVAFSADHNDFTPTELQLKLGKSTCFMTRM